MTSGRFKKGHVPANKSHGMFGTKFYFKYFGLVQRCNDPKATSYPRYGAIGIRNLWPSFEAFRDDMYESYLKHVEEYGERDTTIDRIDSRGNYEKNNCRWATIKEQARNKRDNHFLTVDGETKTLSAWAEDTGVNVGTITSRVNRGWEGRDIFSVKRTKHGELLRVEWEDQQQLLTDLAKRYGLKYHTLYARIFTNGWPIERALTTKVN